MRKILILTLVLLSCGGKERIRPRADLKNPHLFIQVKDYGLIEIELYPRVAPLNVANVVKLARNGFYNGLLFHRVIKNFLIQGGCPKGDGSGNPGYHIIDEIDPELRLQKGTVAMANTGMPNTNGSQFFICLRACPEHDGLHTIIGKVISGWETVEKISEVKTDTQDYPRQDVVMERVWVE